MVPPVTQGGWVPGVVLALLDPLAPGVAAVPGVAVVPGEVWLPGVLVFAVPGLVGGGVVGVAVDGVDCPGVVVCGEVLMPVVLLAPALEVDGCALCAPVLPEVWGAKAAAIRTGEVVRREEEGLTEVHLSPTLRM